MNLGYKIVVVVLILSVVSISLYFIPMALDNQAKFNNLVCRDVLLWSEEMTTVSAYLGKSPTNLAVESAYGHATNAQYIAYTLQQYGVDQYPFPYSHMERLAGALTLSLLGYMTGLPYSVYNVTQSASQILKIMSEKIDNITQLTNLETFRQPNGTSPKQIFDTLNSTNQIVSYCQDADYYAAEVRDANPKLVYP